MLGPLLKHAFRRFGALVEADEDEQGSHVVFLLSP